MAFTRDYFSHTVVLADTSDKDAAGNARLKAISGVNWEVKEVNSDGSVASGASIFSDRSGAPISNTGNTGSNGVIEFWAEPGEYRVSISHPQAVIGDKTITWNSVSGQDGAIPGDAISNNNELDLPTMGQDIVRQFVPIGGVIDWWRPSAGVSVPAGFVVCSGGTVAADAHDFEGFSGSFTVPDLRNKFILGASLSGNGGGSTGDLVTNAPAIGGTGGSNSTRNLTHTHTVYKHNHTLSTSAGRVTFSNPTYSFSGNAMNLDHNHSLAAVDDGGGANYHEVLWRAKGTYPGVTQTNITTGSGWYIDLNYVYQHITTGIINYFEGTSTTPTGSVNVSSNGSISGKAGIANGTGVYDGDTDVSTSEATANITDAHDFRPAYVGLLKIMKVKRS